VSDGAAAVLLTTRAKAAALGLRVLGVFKSYAVVGVPPAVMGVGPAYAIPAALKQVSTALTTIASSNTSKRSIQLLTAIRL
jgi:acetyl-CoA acyltransferase 1